MKTSFKVKTRGLSVETSHLSHKKTAPATCVCDLPTEGIASTTNKDTK
jgi:hypothetical protein